MPATPKWVEPLVAAQKARADRRARNREENRLRNGGNDRTVTVDLPAVEPANDATGSASLRRMRQIMADPTVALFRRIEAGEIVLQYELSAGAAAGVDPQEVTSSAYKMLKAAADNSRTPEGLRFRCLRAIIGVENARAASKATAVTHQAKRALACRLVNAERKRLLVHVGRWHAAINQQWALTLADDFPWPNDSWPDGVEWPVKNFARELSIAIARPEAELLERQALFRAQLRDVKARNRADPFEELLAGDQAA
jgi:hypothetical protein